MRTLDDLVRAGKVRHIGVSKWAPAPIAEAVMLAEFSPAWVLNQPGIVSPTIGPSKMEHLESSLKALDVTLSPEDHERIDQVAPPGSAVSDFYECNVYVPLRWTAGIYRFSGPPHHGRRRARRSGNTARG